MGGTASTDQIANLRRRLAVRRVLARRSPALALAVVGALMLAGCSTFEDVASMIEDDDEIFGDGTEPVEDESFRNLADVPDEPRPASEPAERAAVAEGLIADRERAQYTDETLRSSYDAAQGSAPALDEPLDAGPMAQAADEMQDEMPVTAALEPAASEPPAPEPPADEPAVAARDDPVMTVAPDASDALPEIEPASRAVLAAQAGAAETSSRARLSARVGEDANADDQLSERARAVRERADRQAARTAELAAERRRAATGTRDAPASASDRRAVQAATVADGAAAPANDFRSRFEAQLAASGGAPGSAVTAPESAPPLAGQTTTDGYDRGGNDGRSYAALDRPGLGPVIQSSGVAGPSVSFEATTIYFRNGSSRLSNDDRAKLRRVVSLHQELGGVVRVIGHASQRTRDMEGDRHKVINFGISLDRARAVSEELQRLGVPTERLVVSAAGDSQPVSLEYMPDGEAQNRRAEVFIEY